MKINEVMPLLTEFIAPPLLMVATLGLLLNHVPPEVGVMPELIPKHTEVDPVNAIIGFVLTVIDAVLFDTHPVAALVNTKVAVPADSAETMPAFVTDAMVGLLLDHVPPVMGLKVEVLPSHIEFGPVMFTTGIGFTSIATEVSLLQLPEFLSNVMMAVPAEIAVNTPPLYVIVATLVFEEVQCPPLLLAVKVVIWPTHNRSSPYIAVP